MFKASESLTHSNGALFLGLKYSNLSNALHASVCLFGFCNFVVCVCLFAINLEII